jgi:hypothetical protein
VCIQVTYDATAVAVEEDAGPSQAWPVSSDITDEYEFARSLQLGSQIAHAELAASMGPEPGPAYMSALSPPAEAPLPFGMLESGVQSPD